MPSTTKSDLHFDDGSPQLAATLRPAIRAVHAGIEQGGQRVSGKIHAKWPPWKKRCPPAGVSEVVSDTVAVGQERVWSKLSSKALQQHDSNATTLPGYQEGAEGASLTQTETWAEVSIAEDLFPPRSMSHSQKPRKGRRAKASTHMAAMLESRATMGKFASDGDDGDAT